MSTILEQLKINPKNPRTMDEDKFSKLKNSIREFPSMLEVRPVVYDENFVVLGGNMRLLVLQELSKEGFNVRDDYFTSVSSWTDTQKGMFIIEDNNGLGRWDWDILANEWADDDLARWGVIKEDWAKPEDKLDKEPTKKKLKEITCPKCGEAFTI